ncbi:DUF4271 domain-containing protein [Xanthovirga aplysinae]|uniref:DUF4271 domain-containing protein n=1 Tax=Xanthovirga aplysinae TaxID=2529853 RepID=UPI0012BD4279|nr:DUF4271 domain-containing protein [Xanthovirga aplysinae]MTI33320.1 DUF4271 domain-containing protein [Xanthovirga aplysinae]
MKNILWKCLVLFFCILGVSLRGYSQQDEVSDYKLAKDFTPEWLIYENQSQTYVPYVLNTPFHNTSASFTLSTEKFSGSTLFYEVQGGSTLFIDRKIVAFFPKDTIRLFNLDSLVEVFQKQDLFVTLYNPEFIPRENRIGILADEVAFSEISNDRVHTTLEIRSSESKNNFMISSFLLIALLLTIVINKYSRTSRGFFSLNHFFWTKGGRDALGMNRATPNFSFGLVLLYALLQAYVWLITAPFLENLHLAFARMGELNFSGYSLLWLKISAVIIAFLLLKYVLIALVSSLFGVSDLRNVHFFDFLKIGLIGYLILAILLLIFFTNRAFFSPVYSIILPILFLTVLFFRVLILLIKLISVQKLSGVQLFSYLCGTEILPLIVGLKILFK